MKIKKTKLDKFKLRVDQWMLHYQTGNCTGTNSFTQGWQEDDNGIPALEALYLFESRGKRLPTSELDMLETYLQAKAHLDLNIKNWAEDRAKGWLGKMEFTNMVKEMGYPEWVFTAVENQKQKLYKTTIFSL